MPQATIYSRLADLDHHHATLTVHWNPFKLGKSVHVRVHVRECAHVCKCMLVVSSLYSIQTDRSFDYHFVKTTFMSLLIHCTHHAHPSLITVYHCIGTTGRVGGQGRAGQWMKLLLC